MHYQTYYERILSLLKTKNLLTQNESNVKKLNDFPDSDSKCMEFFRLLEYLDKNQILDNKSLTKCLEIIQTKPEPKYSWQTEKESYDARIFNLLIWLNRYSILITEKIWISCLI